MRIAWPAVQFAERPLAPLWQPDRRVRYRVLRFVLCLLYIGSNRVGSVRQFTYKLILVAQTFFSHCEPERRGGFLMGSPPPHG